MLSLFIEEKFVSTINVHLFLFVEETLPFTKHIYFFELETYVFELTIWEYVDDMLLKLLLGIYEDEGLSIITAL